MTFIAGRMTATYGGTTVGQVADGFTIEHTVRKRLITGDVNARSPQDAVFQGHEVFIEFTLMEYDAGAARASFWPYDSTWGDAGAVGRLDVASSLVKALVLTETTGHTAENNPNTLTADRAILAPGFPVEILFRPDLREIPLRMQLFPNASSIFFALT